MKKTLKHLCLAVLTAIIIPFSLTSCGVFNKIVEKEPIFENHTITEEITEISIFDKWGTFDITLKESSDDTAEISYIGHENTGLEYEIINGLLSIKTQDNRNTVEKMYTFNNDVKITVMIPKKEYKRVCVDTTSGSVKVSDLKAESLTVRNTSGDITVSDSAIGNILIDSSSGDINMRSLTSSVKLTIDVASGDTDIRNSKFCEIKHYSTGGDIELEGVTFSGMAEIDTTSGEVDFDAVEGEEVYIDTSSGDVILKDSTFTSVIDIATNSGEVQFYRIDGGQISVITESGDVEGTILTKKNFITSSKSGTVKVPASADGAAICHINTNSGDIEVKISN